MMTSFRCRNLIGQTDLPHISVCLIYLLKTYNILYYRKVELFLVTWLYIGENHLIILRLFLFSSNILWFTAAFIGIFLNKDTSRREFTKMLPWAELVLVGLGGIVGGAAGVGVNALGGCDGNVCTGAGFWVCHTGVVFCLGNPVLNWLGLFTAFGIRLLNWLKFGLNWLAGGVNWVDCTW